MLIDELVDFCDKKYKTYGNKCGCEKCNHPAGECSGDCYNCLYQIHFPGRFPGKVIKTVYDCPKMLYHYVCQYSYLYATEILYALESEKNYLEGSPYYHIMSLGCGACADLMAFEQFRDSYELQQPISYIGFDINELWKPINNRITKYCDYHSIIHKVHYDDVFKCFRQTGIRETNVVIISYLISYLYNTKQIDVIDSFLNDFMNNIILKKKQDQKLLLIINDVNSYKRGRNYFKKFIDNINSYHLSIINCDYRYFDTGNLYDGQKIGTAYVNPHCLFTVPQAIKNTYHTDTDCKQTIQLLLEVK